MKRISHDLWLDMIFIQNKVALDTTQRFLQELIATQTILHDVLYTGLVLFQSNEICLIEHAKELFRIVLFRQKKKNS